APPVAPLRHSPRSVAWRALRYFNVAGCDPEGVLGEDHTPETHLVPLVLQVALGTRPAITVFGTDYPTEDGTCVRDYIHVSDLADAHARVMSSIVPQVPAAQPPERPAYNLGNGRGFSVRQIITAAERVTGRPIKVLEGPRRPGDPPRVFADPSRIQRELGWTARHADLDGIIRSAWDWMLKYPSGYPKPSRI
ncbi:MAG: NAD-dependent epimerase/dehydratase family protein, partial [Phycisphaerales bacterium]